MASSFELTRLKSTKNVEEGTGRGREGGWVGGRLRKREKGTVAGRELIPLEPLAMMHRKQYQYRMPEYLGLWG